MENECWAYEASDDIDELTWLYDASEDIYTIQDGKPFDAEV